MFQSFDDTGGPAHGAERLALLRAELARRGLTGFLVPRADEHQNEFVPAHAERLLWLTGFSGSWGVAAVLADQAALFVDGRYVLQARAQVDRAAMAVVTVAETGLKDWLGDHLTPGDRLGYDPRLHTISEVKTLLKAVDKSEARLVPQTDNPVDALWQERPAPPAASVTLHPLAFAGRSAADKIADLQAVLREAGEDAVVLAALDSIAWLFNIRGQDVAHTPFVLAHAIVPAEGRPELFVAGQRVGAEVRAALEAVAVLAEPETLAQRLDVQGAAGALVRLDPRRTGQWFAERLKAAGAAIAEHPDPCLLPKARKNAAEIAGARAAHLRDGAAMCRFLAWLDAHAPSGEVDEITAARTLERFRAETCALQEISFDSISGAGAHGAIVHYRVTAATNRLLTPGTLYLIDSGGQYLDGTTDVTRTIALGEPDDAMCRHFTLVLKGHVAIAAARFPKGTRGADLDAFARRALWQAGLDYDHGTGHGVGSYLAVHEGPQGLSKRTMAELEPGMILSNEPGYYREGQYGIRIENLLLVTEPEAVPGGERAMMGFETLTLAPIDRRLILASLLTAEESAWVDAYHARVRREIAPHVDDEVRAWLEAATAPIA